MARNGADPTIALLAPRTPPGTLHSIVIAARALSGRAHGLSPALLDGLLALLVATAAFARLLGSPAPLGDVRLHAADSLGAGLLLAGSLSLAWRRRAPLAVLAVSGAASLIYAVLGYAPTPLPFAPLIALYTVAAQRPPRLAAGAILGLSACVAAADVGHPLPISHDQFLADLLSLPVAFALGYGVRRSRLRVSTLEQRAGEQVEGVRVAVAAEQARIARELHDIVAHNVSVIVAQAAAARRVFDAEPARARQALGAIEQTAREALVEMRRLLGVLAADPAAERAPQPGLDRLPGLLAQVRRAGLAVEVQVRGAPRPLPAGVELSAFRIVQEALTNTLKHAGAARAGVVLGYRAGGLWVRVWDDGRGVAVLVPGQGLVGMQQRAALLGGRLAVGPRPGGGFQVTATLPNGR